MFSCAEFTKKTYIVVASCTAVQQLCLGNEVRFIHLFDIKNQMTDNTLGGRHCVF